MNFTVVTLVHGTFAPAAKWTRRDSPLCQKLIQEIGAENLRFEIFKWSGKNSHHARLEAADTFSLHLRSVLERYPSASHCIIAHSHGGNVALYALRGFDALDKIRVICVSTPFLHFEPRKITVGLASIAFMVGTLFAAISLALTFLLYSRIGSAIIPSSGRNLLGMLTCLFAPVVAFGLVKKVTFSFLPHLVAVQTKSLEKLRLPGLNETPIYALCYTKDEARRYLAFIEQASNTPFSMLEFFIRAHSDLLNLGAWLSEKAGILGWVVVTLIAALSFLASPIWFLMWMAHVGLKQHLGAFGEQLSDGLLLRVSVQAAPPPNVKAEFVSFENVSAATQRHRKWWHLPTLLHSLLYSDSAALDEIARIISEPNVSLPSSKMPGGL